MKIELMLFKDLQIALLQQRLVQAVARAFTAAGLDPTKRYQLNDTDFSATEQ